MSDELKTRLLSSFSSSFIVHRFDYVACYFSDDARGLLFRLAFGDDADYRLRVRAAHEKPAVVNRHLDSVAQIQRTARVFASNRLQNLAYLIRTARELF